ncbi:hypothetical protein [uncultured Clostridium sp.]|jgi:hypothetical protein|uniref:hypothetical protein n=1 Tax=uncultured Clostridium sp. TaxID=59620 RepID=UPI002612E967|nr:hypothetical protein [uncultured Clostridium sp.]
MLEFKKKSLLSEIEYEDYDVNVVKLTTEDQKELGMIKSCCGKATSECPKTNGAGSCCGSKNGCPKN